MSLSFEHDVEITNVDIQLEENQATETETEQTIELQINPAIERKLSVTNSENKDDCQGSSVTHYELSDFGDDQNNVYTEYPAAYDQYETTEYIGSIAAIKESKSKSKPQKKYPEKVPPYELSKKASTIMVAIFGFILFLIIAIFFVLFILLENIDNEAEKAENEGKQLENEFTNLTKVLIETGILEFPGKVRHFQLLHLSLLTET